jgi:hypothetical protein
MDSGEFIEYVREADSGLKHALEAIEVVCGKMELEVPKGLPPKKAKELISGVTWETIFDFYNSYYIVVGGLRSVLETAEAQVPRLDQVGGYVGTRIITEAYVLELVELLDAATSSMSQMSNLDAFAYQISVTSDAELDLVTGVYRKYSKKETKTCIDLYVDILQNYVSSVGTKHSITLVDELKYSVLQEGVVEVAPRPFMKNSIQRMLLTYNLVPDIGGAAPLEVQLLRYMNIKLKAGAGIAGAIGLKKIGDIGIILITKIIGPLALDNNITALLTPDPTR